jgi:hypothetical protein
VRQSLRSPFAVPRVCEAQSRHRIEQRRKQSFLALQQRHVLEREQVMERHTVRQSLRSCRLGLHSSRHSRTRRAVHSPLRPMQRGAVLSAEN